MSSCPKCLLKDALESIPASGETVCQRCGIIVEESNIVAAVEFQESAGGSRCAWRHTETRV